MSSRCEEEMKLDDVTKIGVGGLGFIKNNYSALYYHFGVLNSLCQASSFLEKFFDAKQVTIYSK